MKHLIAALETLFIILLTALVIYVISLFPPFGRWMMASIWACVTIQFTYYRCVGKYDNNQNQNQHESKSKKVSSGSGDTAVRKRG